MTGLIAQHPTLPGVAWDYLQYPVGLSRLGHDVYYFEDSGQWPYTLAPDRSGDWEASDCRANIEHLEAVLSQFGMGGRWSYRFPPSGEWFGLSDRLRAEIISTADLLINVSGTLEEPDRYQAVPRRVYIDTDPVFTQVRLTARTADLGLPPKEEREERKFRRRVLSHDVHFTFGETLPTSSPLVPETGVTWRPTRQPILLSEWPASDEHRDVFTTVMSWTSYRPLRFRGRTYAQKDAELRKFIDLPRMAPDVRLELAMNGLHHSDWETDTETREPLADWTPELTLRQHGWDVVDASEVCRDLDSYRTYIARSAGEWSVAKHAYVAAVSGWFSCRSACYLAAGRPVIVQDTGFSSVLPTGEGLFAFHEVEEAARALDDVSRDHVRHSKAARGLADEYFSATHVLRDLLDASLT